MLRMDYVLNLAAPHSLIFDVTPAYKNKNATHEHKFL